MENIDNIEQGMSYSIPKPHFRSCLSYLWPNYMAPTGQDHTRIRQEMFHLIFRFPKEENIEHSLMFLMWLFNGCLLFEFFFVYLPFMKSNCSSSLDRKFKFLNILENPDNSIKWSCSFSIIVQIIVFWMLLESQSTTWKSG